MSMRMRTSMLLAMATVFAVGAFAVKPAYTGKLGNEEEPGTRPYKAVWRGLKALKYHTFASFKEGNEKVKCVGSIEVFRGIRRGLVELGESTYRGMAGERMPNPSVPYKINQYIDQDMRVRPWADLAPAAAVMGAAGVPPVGMVFGPAAVLIAQNGIDYAAMDENERKRVAAEGRQKRECKWSSDPRERARETRKHIERRKAERQKQEAQAPPASKAETPYSGNIIEKVRKGEL